MVHNTYAANTTTQNNRQSSQSGSVGVGINLGAGGTNMGVTVSASRGTGQGAGSGTTYTHTQVSSDTVQIESGGDTTLKGAVVKADQVTATVGGDLLIETLQDTHRYNERSRSAGGSVTIGPAPGGSLNLGQTRINSTYQSATEQSGIRAGDGGFQVNVAGNTTLTGGVITSSEQAVQDNRNQFTTAGQTAQAALESGALTLSDLNNNASYSARSTSVGLGAGAAQPGQSPSAALSGVGLGRDSGSASSTTQAGISGLAGNTAARTGDAETGIKPIFNQDEARREVNAQVAITQEFGKQASKAVGDYAKAQYDQARAAGDTDGMAALEAGGGCRVLHTVVKEVTNLTHVKYNQTSIEKIRMKPSIALQQNRVAIRYVVERHHARNARVFGSVVHGDDHEGSDLDILIDPTPTTTLMDVARIQVELENLLGVSVDVLTPKALPEKFRGQVLAEAVPV